jgi:hypothetical protein
MAELLGKTEDAAGFQARMDKIEGAFNTTFWQEKGGFYRSPSHKGETDDRANAMAVVAGFAKPEMYPAITQFLSTNTHASPYMEKYVLEAFFMMGEADAGFARMLRRYNPMIDCDETTLWENFAREGSDEPGSGTYNHAWSGGPLTMMHQYVAGIAPVEAGFKRFSVKPQLGPLEKVETSVPTPHGEIKLAVTKDREKLLLKLVVPEGTSAELTVDWKKTVLGEGTHEVGG